MAGRVRSVPPNVIVLLHLAGRVVTVLSRIMAVCARPLDFQVKLRIQRTIFIHAFCCCGFVPWDALG